jgi:hypothetical protein
MQNTSHAVMAQRIVSATSHSSGFSFAGEPSFETLVALWHRERDATSSITQMAMCPAYQRIIGMGPKVIPTILRKMEQEGDEPDMWFWALRALTGEDPVLDEERGNIVLMARAWLNWGRQFYVR